MPQIAEKIFPGYCGRREGEQVTGNSPASVGRNPEAPRAAIVQGAYAEQRAYVRAIPVTLSCTKEAWSGNSYQKQVSALQAL